MIKGVGGLFHILDRIKLKIQFPVLWLLGFWLFITGGGFGEGWPNQVKYLILLGLVLISIRTFFRSKSNFSIVFALIFIYAASRFLARGELSRNDVLVICYGLFFAIAYSKVKALKIKPELLAVVVCVQFILSLLGYLVWQVNHSSIRYRLTFEGQEIDPNLTTICFVFAALAVASIARTRLIKVSMVLMAIATCVMFESRSATLLLLTYTVILGWKEKRLGKVILSLVGLASVVLLTASTAVIFDVQLPPRIINVLERFQPDNLRSEEEAEGARFEIYSDISKCLEMPESILFGCKMGSQKNPHNEFVRGYVDAGLIGVTVTFMALWLSFNITRGRSRCLLIAGYVPMLFYGFTFYLFAPVFFTMLLYERRVRKLRH